MADHHKGYSQPIGGVVAYRGQISPSGVGYDIGCGNKAVRTNLLASDVMPQIGSIMDRIASTIAFGVGAWQSAIWSIMSCLMIQTGTCTCKSPGKEEKGMTS